MNQVTLIGNLGAEPEIRMSNGKEWASMRLATTARWKDLDGQKRERTDWHSLTVSGGLVQVVKSYLHTGDKIAVTGEVNYREHDGKYYTTIKVKQLEMLGQRHDQGSKATEHPEPTGASRPMQDKDDLPF